MIDREARQSNEAASDVYPGLHARPAFTLIELLVAVGILVLLAGLLLHAVSHSYNQAQLQAQQFDFQTIASALENYNKDFHAYPSNSSLPTWATWKLTGLSPGSKTPAPIFMSLASALLGPGPATPAFSYSLIPNTPATPAGDGADGPGFRATVQSTATVLTSTVPAGGMSVTVQSVPDSWVPKTTSPVDVPTKNVWAISSITLSPGTIWEETLPVQSVSGTGPYIITLGKNNVSASTQFPHSQSSTPPLDAYPLLKTASGKVYNYLPDTMKYQYDSNGQPELLDHWGGVIQYFSRFGPTPTNRMSNSSYLPNPLTFTPTAGPLYGCCTPASVEAAANNGTPIFPVGGNTIWDFRDGAPNANNPFNSWLPSAPIPNQPINDPHWALMWMLGDDNFDNFIGPGETLRFDGPYILISAGPTGNLCNFMQLFASTNTNPAAGTFPTASQCQNFFAASGNIYNFTR